MYMYTYSHNIIHQAIPQCWGHGSFARCESGCYGMRAHAWCIYGTSQGAQE